MIFSKSQRGVSLIAAIFILVILAFMGVMFLTMINTASLTSVNDLQSAQALYIAEGGVEFEQLNLAQNLDWYRSATDPLYNDTGNLGAGSFTATVRAPATKLRRRLLPGDATASVYTTSGFPASGFLQIDEDVTSNAEFVQYTILNATTFTLTARGVNIGTIATAPTTTFSRGTAVYPVMTLSLAGGLLSSCASPTSFTIVSAAAPIKLLSAGTIDIEGEEISYSGSTISGASMILTGVQRCRGSIGPVAHANGQPVTPVLIGGDSASYEAEVNSIGTAGAAVRSVKKTVQR